MDQKSIAETLSQSVRYTTCDAHGVCNDSARAVAQYVPDGMHRLIISYIRERHTPSDVGV